MYESNGKLHTGIVKYGDCITVKVATRNYVGKTLAFKIYEDINWAKDPKKNETIKIPIDKQGKGEAEFMVPTAWESDHKDASTVRYFYLEHNGDDFPRSFYIKTKGKEENEVESKPRVRALMLKVSTTLELDEKLEADNAVVLGEELNVPTGSGKACEPLVWGDKFTCTERKKVIEICAELWGEDKKMKMANNLMAVFAWESGGTFKTNVPNMGNSGGTGLIQLMPKTAKSLLGKDISVEYVKNYWGKEKTLKRVKEFANMTVLKQLDYVKKYFKPQAGKDLEFVDFYLQVLFPASSGKKNHVVFSENGEGLDVNDRHFKLRVKAYAQNKGMDADKNGKLMKNEIALSVQKYLTKGEAFKNNCSAGGCTLRGDKHDGTVKEGYDIEKAVNYIIANVEPKSIGYCAKYVRLAIVAGGINTDDRPAGTNAKDYDTYLVKKGFIIIDSSNYSPIKGDIAVFEAFQGEKKYHKWGHIEMFTGDKWVSDFIQNDFWAGSDYRKAKPKYTILRWK
ncbi:hypothetical protein [Tenacibaculum finnmarkense]|uniref:hypothetical protein n=1 Tax=Tenacibaculum finnmarkense TaxID=2781243 RepID=UPI001EFB428F|nr:hypothetical protein [Tenacibaculum finnmarkense]